MLGKMKGSLILTLLLSFTVGCARLPKDQKLVSLWFRDDPLANNAEEAIEQIEIVAPAAVVHRVHTLPTDWTAGVSRPPNGLARCILGCDHNYFAVSDIHHFDGRVSLCVPAQALPEIKVQIFVTRGPLGPGRIITLAEKDVVLK